MDISILQPKGLHKEGDTIDFISRHESGSGSGSGNASRSDRDANPENDAANEGENDTENENGCKSTTAGTISLNKTGEIKWDVTIPGGCEERFVLEYVVRIPVWGEVLEV